MILEHDLSAWPAADLLTLCGPVDSHLRQIEAALGVKVQCRHGVLRLEGTAPAVRDAQTVLRRLEADLPHGVDAQKVAWALLPQDEPRSPLGRARSASAPTEPDGEGSARAVGALRSPLRTRRSDLVGRTPNQRRYLEHILRHDITFGIGPAGTGKTFLAVACAVDALERQTVQRIVLTRPAVEAGERLGFLPGDLAQKVDPYLRPLYDALYDLMGVDKVGKAFERGLIEVAPLAFMRGRTLNHAFVILDEAQNTSPEQMKMFLTRIGFGSKAVVTGDVSQIDLPKHSLSGLVDAERILRDVPGIAHTRFTALDVVRHPLVARIVDAYDADHAEREKWRELQAQRQAHSAPSRFD